MSQAYLASHDSNLLMELAPVEARISLQEKGRREMMDPRECLPGNHFFSLVKFLFLLFFILFYFLGFLRPPS